METALTPMEISTREAGALKFLFPQSQEAMIKYIERFGQKIRDIVMENPTIEDPELLGTLIDTEIWNSK
jgi:hypothetical protein